MESHLSTVRELSSGSFVNYIDLQILAPLYLRTIYFAYRAAIDVIVIHLVPNGIPVIERSILMHS